MPLEALTFEVCPGYASRKRGNRAELEHKQPRPDKQIHVNGGNPSTKQRIYNMDQHEDTNQTENRLADVPEVEQPPVEPEPIPLGPETQAIIIQSIN
jgi:hypothetical protein